MKNMTQDLLSRIRRLEEQGELSEDVSLKVKRLVLRHDRALRHGNKDKARNLLSEICDLLIGERKR